MKRAIVIGGGIGGLASAIALRDAGWEVEVFERAAELREVGAGLAVWANGLKALDRLGVGATVRVGALPSAEGWIRTASGEPLMALMTDALRARFGELGIMVHRADLLAILLEALGQGRVRLGAELTAIEEDGGGVTATFADGRRATGDVLVGADGLRSTVREHLHGHRPPRYAGYTAWRTVVSFPPARLLPGESWGRGARFGQAPLRDGRAYLFATRDAPPGARSPDGEKAELMRLFGGWHHPIPELIEAMDEAAILRNDVLDLPPLRRWGRGRVTLLGDAAHPMTPNLGQGACQALEDAVVLARWLRPDAEPEGALRAYEAERIPRTAAFVRRSFQVGRVGQWSHPLAVRMRDLAARHLLGRLQPRQLAELAAVDL